MPDATDSARELAEEHDLDLAEVEGTGEDGRILKGDVEQAIADREDASEPAAPTGGEEADDDGAGGPTSEEEDDDGAGDPDAEAEDADPPEEPEEASDEVLTVDLAQDVRAENGTLYRAGRGRRVPASVVRGLSAAVAAVHGGQGEPGAEA